MSVADFVKIARLDDIPPGALKRLDIEGDPIVIANVEGQLFAFGAECTHQGGPLDEGYLDGDVVTCPWHSGQFNVKTGEVEAPPPATPVPVYPVKVEGEDVYVGIG
jgi:nitrite reductase/ring-hydroxylating ferredoxin subunit